MESIDSVNEFVMHGCETPKGFLKRIETSLDDYIKSWHNSKDQASRMVSNFIKCGKSFLRCKHGISKKNIWLLEKESCLWMGPTKSCKKTTYLREQCEYIERIYGGDEAFLPWMREIMRINGICVLTGTLRGVAFDHTNEMYNYFLKIPPSTPYIDTAVERSTYTMLQRKCATHIFESPIERSSRQGASEQVDIRRIEGLLDRANIFRTQDEREMDNTVFWNVVRPRKIVGSSLDKSKETSQFAEWELRVNERLIQHVEVAREFDDDHKDDDDCNVSVVSSVAESIRSEGVSGGVIDDEMVGEDTFDNDNEWTETRSAASASAALKKLGNVKKRKYNKLAVRDLFDHGKHLLKDIKKTRRKAIKRQKRERQLIRMSVQYFKTQLEYRRTILRSRMEKSKTNSYVFEPREWEARYKQIMADRRANGFP